MLVKELAAKSGVSKYSLDNYLNNRGQIPSVEIGVKIAKALGVSMEYLVTGEASSQQFPEQKINTDTRLIIGIVEQFDKKKRKFAIEFLKWLNDQGEVF